MSGNINNVSDSYLMNFRDVDAELTNIAASTSSFVSISSDSELVCCEDRNRKVNSIATTIIGSANPTPFTPQMSPLSDTKDEIEQELLKWLSQAKSLEDLEKLKLWYRQGRDAATNEALKPIFDAIREILGAKLEREFSVTEALQQKMPQWIREIAVELENSLSGRDALGKTENEWINDLVNSQAGEEDWYAECDGRIAVELECAAVLSDIVDTVEEASLS